MPDLYKLCAVLDKKVNEGIDKLDKTDISLNAYDKTLTNISYKPQPKKETKLETKEKKEN